MKGPTRERGHSPAPNVLKCSTKVDIWRYIKGPTKERSHLPASSVTRNSKPVPCHIWSWQMASLLCGSFHVSSNGHFGWTLLHIWSRRMASLMCGSFHVYSNYLPHWMPCHNVQYNNLDWYLWTYTLYYRRQYYPGVTPYNWRE